MQQTLTVVTIIGDGYDGPMQTWLRCFKVKITYTLIKFSFSNTVHIQIECEKVQRLIRQNRFELTVQWSAARRLPVPCYFCILSKMDLQVLASRKNFVILALNFIYIQANKYTHTPCCGCIIIITKNNAKLFDVLHTTRIRSVSVTLFWKCGRKNWLKKTSTAWNIKNIYWWFINCILTLYAYHSVQKGFPTDLLWGYDENFSGFNVKLFKLSFHHIGKFTKFFDVIHCVWAISNQSDGFKRDAFMKHLIELGKCIFAATLGFIMQKNLVTHTK